MCHVIISRQDTEQWNMKIIMVRNRAVEVEEGWRDWSDMTDLVSGGGWRNRVI